MVVGQSLRSEEENVSFSAESERVKLEKPDLATWRKSKGELEFENYNTGNL